jgi:uncharacterized membrane protein
MARDIQDRFGQFLGSDSGKQLVGAAVGELLGSFRPKPMGSARKRMKKSARPLSGSSGGPLSGTRGVAAGAGAAALAPVAVKGIGKLIKGNGSLSDGPKKLAEGAGRVAAAPKKLAEGAGAKLGDSVGDKVSSKIDEAGGPSGILKDTVKSALPFGGGGGPKGGVDGVGKGRRMPVQQSVDIAVPIESVYNEWTQFEEWPLFMHRVTRVTQKDPCTISFATKIWGKTKEFTAKIETQRPDERVKWRVTQGITHTGLVTFHELGPRLTRVELGLDVQPGSLLEKFARGARHVKRAARADLHRFKAFIEMLEHETGAWRGVIEDGELVKDHDQSYDRKREYASAHDLLEDSDESRNGGDPGERASRSQSRGSSSRRSSSGRSSSGSGSRRPSSRSSSSRQSSGKSQSPRSSGRRSSSGGGSSGGSRSKASSSGRSGRASSRASGSSSNGGSATGASSRRRSTASRSSRTSSARSQGRQRTGSSRRS